ncbi:FMN-binding negative transcriptional regulator [Rhizobium mesosinicum]|uniref:FMN-binding negative transcriptional regulator n=1 Tax=Rhizobium mesosinicum TaxID=335017 RepID=A0ABS7GM31_9HYPH|nr:FMN-binding negative transcriptional regulator [Rhizobium mesosinicum]MBW9051048.1 FMN-binding negative transcriptional regulator [Rhizobium mesosinicum]
MLARKDWETSSEEALDFIEDDPWALVISNAREVPLVTATPILLDRGRGEMGTLVGHIARANPQADILRNGGRVLTLFQGPRTYVSPSWYPGRNMAPTMYYVIVEVEGVVTLQDPDTMRKWVERLTHRYETHNPDAWSMHELSEDGIARRMKAIVGFDIEIRAIRGKVKVGQDEPRLDALAVASKLAGSENAADVRLAELIKRKKPQSG